MPCKNVIFAFGALLIASCSSVADENSATIVMKYITNEVDPIEFAVSNPLKEGSGCESCPLEKSKSHEDVAPFKSPFSENTTVLINSIVDKSKGKTAFDVKLSNIAILGFSDEARVSAIKELRFDPWDLNITNTANYVASVNEKDWLRWRKQQMEAFVVAVSKAYKARYPNAKLMIVGQVDYYGQQEFNDLRSGQDWLAWAQTGAVDGVFLEGKWLSRYGDADRFADYARRWDELIKPAGHPVALIPVSGGSSDVAQSNYARDWQILKAKVPSLVQMGLKVDGERDRKEAKLFLAGKPIPVAAQVPAVGALMPEFLFPDGSGKTLGPQNWVNQSAVEMLLLPTSFKTANLVKALEAAAPALKERGAQAVVVAPTRLDTPTTLATLTDSGRELLDLLGKRPTLARIDKAGFVRGWQTVTDAKALDKALEQKLEVPTIEVGQPAPDFVMTDMDGKTRRLSELKGKKNLLLTFFPKCFTGGCQNHLTSIQNRLDDYKIADTEVWAVSIDPADVQRDFSAMWKFQFPLVPDVGRNLSLLYGAAQNTEQLSDRMSVFIDKAGVVRIIDKQVIVGSHGSDMLKKMEELKLGK